MYDPQSFSGVELLRVLIANNAGPVLMIAFTNHALDHMLRSVLDAQITKNIVRLGSRSADERIAEFSIEHVEMVAGKSRLNYVFSGYRRALRDVEDEIKEFMNNFFKMEVDSEDILQYLRFDSPVLLESFWDPPAWIGAIRTLADEHEGWRVVGADGKALGERDDSLYGFWVRGGDIEFLHKVHFDIRYRQPNAQRHMQQSSTNRFDALSSEILDDSQQIPETFAVAEDGTRADHTETVATEEMGSDSDDDFVSVDASPEEEWLNDVMLLGLDDAEVERVGDPNEPRLQSGPTTTPVAPAIANRSRISPTISTAPHSSHTDIRPDDFMDIRQFFAAFGCPDIPAVPVTSRPMHQLLGEDDVWSMSAIERQLLHKRWTDEVRVTSRETQTQEFRRLHEKHARAAQEYQEGQAEVCGQDVMVFPASCQGCEYRSGNNSFAMSTSLDVRPLVSVLALVCRPDLADIDPQERPNSLHY